MGKRAAARFALALGALARNAVTLRLRAQTRAYPGFSRLRLRGWNGLFFYGFSSVRHGVHLLQCYSTSVVHNEPMSAL